MSAIKHNRASVVDHENRRLTGGAVQRKVKKKGTHSAHGSMKFLKRQTSGGYSGFADEGEVVYENTKQEEQPVYENLQGR